MALKTLKSILLFGILIALVSCKWLDSSDNNGTQNSSLSMGEVVSEIHDKIWAIYQDQNENYWFGSNGYGVFHYDGTKLIRFSKKDGLVDNYIRGIQGDHLGNVYIETPEGISKYDGKSFTTLKLIVSSTNEWKLESNDLWFKCNGNPNDIYRYDGESLVELKLPRKDLNKAFGKEVVGLGFNNMNSSPYSVFGINKDKKGNLWIGTIVAGAFRYDGESFLWIAEKELSTLPDGRVPGVRSIIEDKDGYFWLSNFKNKYRISDVDSNAEYEKLKGIDNSNGQFDGRLPYFNSGISDNNDVLWMVSYGGGVWKYDGGTLMNYPIKNGETKVLLIDIYKDNKGVIWLGTDNAGVYKQNGETFEKFEPMKKASNIIKHKTN